MAHPFASQARSGSRAKFKAMVGKSGSGQSHPDEPQDRKLIKQVMAERGYAEGGSVSGGKSTPRADRYARDGKVGKVNINIVVPQKESPPAPPMLPPIPPPGLAGPPPGGPPVPPGLPMMRKAGGRVVKKARGGRFTGGAETGTGRLEKASHQKARRGR